MQRDDKNLRRARFVERMAEGNATASQAARDAGYSARSAALQGHRLMHDERITSAIDARRSEAMRAAGVSAIDAYEALGRAMADGSPKVRAPMVRAAEIVLRASGELAPDSVTQVDARTVLWPGAAQLSVVELEGMLDALDAGQDGIEVEMLDGAQGPKHE